MKLNGDKVNKKSYDDGSKVTTKQIKKKNRYFESYISKILNHTSPINGITYNAKQQLNSAICIVAKEISKLSIQLTEISKKKTISDKEIINSIKIIFIGDLATNSIRETNKSIENFTKINSYGGSRQGRAGIIFPPSIAEKFLRNFGYSKIMVTSIAPICLATILEYFTAEILTSAVKYSNDNNRIRITIRDLELSIGNDKEFSYLFNKLHITFLGGGVIPFIHPCLLTKKIHKYKKKDILDENKSHRFRPGTVAIREIKKYQKMSDCLILSKIPFERIVRNLTFTINNNINIKISKDVFIILQHFIEQYIISIIKDANAAAIHAGRLKLMLSDIQFICSIKEYYK
jgi:histone H3/H4